MPTGQRTAVTADLQTPYMPHTAAQHAFTASPAVSDLFFGPLPSVLPSSLPGSRSSLFTFSTSLAPSGVSTLATGSAPPTFGAAGMDSTMVMPSPLGQGGPARELFGDKTANEISRDVFNLMRVMKDFHNFSTYAVDLSAPIAAFERWLVQAFQRFYTAMETMTHSCRMEAILRMLGNASGRSRHETG